MYHIHLSIVLNSGDLKMLEPSAIVLHFDYIYSFSINAVNLKKSFTEINVIQNNQTTFKEIIKKDFVYLLPYIYLSN